MSHWRDTGETVPSGRCDDCDASVWHLRVLVHDDGCKTELCERCRDQYILQQGKSAIIAQASPCPTCEATQREMAELRAKIAALAKEMDVYDRNPTLRYFEQKLRALLAQPGARQEEGEEA